MNQVFIANSTDSICTDMDKIVQYEVDIELFVREDEKYLANTRISAYLSEQWKVVLMNESLIIPREFAAVSDGVYSPDEGDEQTTNNVIQSGLRYLYWSKIEHMVHDVAVLKQSKDLEPSQRFLIPREYLSIVHSICEEFGEAFVIEAQWH